MSISLALEIGAAATTILQLWFYGNKSLAGPVWGLIAVVFWWALVIWTGLWGLIPLNLFAMLVNIRNLVKWTKKQ